MASAKAKKKKQVNNKTAAAETTPHEWLYLVAFWGLALLLFFPPYFRGLFFAAEQEKALILAALVFWAAFLWRWLQRDYKFLATPLDWFALALPAAYILSAFAAVNKGEAVEEVVKNALYFLTFWAVSRLVRRERDAENIIKVIYASAAGAALAGLATATGIIYIKDGFLGGRIYSTFQYPNALAAYLGGVLFFGLYLWNRARDRHKEALEAARDNIFIRLDRVNLWGYLYACGNYLLLAVLFGTRSRGGLLVFALVFIIYLLGAGAERRLTSALHLGCLGAAAFTAVNKFIPLAVEGQAGRAWLWVLAGLALALAGQALFHLLDGRVLARWSGSGRKLNLAFGILAVAAVITAGVWLSGHPGVSEKVTDFNYLKNAYHRIYFIEDALEMIKDRPLLGWGGGGWKEAYRSYMDYRYISREVHSYYFQLGVETGILGLMAVAGIWLSFLYLAHRLYHGSRAGSARRQLTWALTAAFLMIAGHALIDFDLSLSALTLVLWSTFGMAAGLAREGEREETKTARRKYQAPRYLPAVAATAVIVLLITGISFLVQSRSLMARGIILLKSNQVARGLEYMERAAACNPFNAGYRITLSQVYKSLGKDNEALAQARKAVSLSRYDTAPRENLARIAAAAGSRDEAAEAAAATVELAPNELRVYENLARTFTLLGIEELKAGSGEKAREFFGEALQVPEKMARRWESVSETGKKMWQGPRLAVSPKLKLHVGEASYWLGEFPAAEKNLKEAAGDKKIKAEALMYLALLRDKQGRQQDAAGLLEQAKKLSPGIEQQYEELKKVPVL